MENLVGNQFFGFVVVFSGGFLFFVIIDGDIEGSFNIEGQRGEIRITKFLDREYIFRYDFIVIVIINDGILEVKVIVIVLDVNDNKLEFKYEFLDVELQENSVVGYEVYYAFVVDDDFG